MPVGDGVFTQQASHRLSGNFVWHSCSKHFLIKPEFCRLTFSETNVVLLFQIESAFDNPSVAEDAYNLWRASPFDTAKLDKDAVRKMDGVRE